MSGVVTNNQYPDMVRKLVEEIIVWESLEIYPLESTNPFIYGFRMFGCSNSAGAELLVEIISQFGFRDVLIISHDGIDFGKDTRMENDLHTDLLCEIFASNSSNATPTEGFASSSASRRRASPSPSSGSAKRAGSECSICKASVARCRSGSSKASFSTASNVVML